MRRRSGSCTLKAPPFGPCVIDVLAPVRIPPFNDIAEAEVGLNLRLAADGSVTVPPPIPELAHALLLTQPLTWPA